MQYLQLELIRTIMAQPQHQQSLGFIIHISLAPTQPSNVIDITPNETDEELDQLEEKHEQEQEWNDRNHSAYIDEYRNESDL